MLRHYYTAIIIIITSIITIACSPANNLGMVRSDDGNLYGSVVEKNFVVDASQFDNNKIKLTLRNTSGDLAYDIEPLRNSIEKSLVSKGYQLTQNNDFGIRLDINLKYSGYIRKNLTNEYAFLGGTAGALAGYHENDAEGAIVGTIAGATLAGVLGSYSSDNTYIIISEVTLAVADPHRGINKKVITFSRSPPLEQRRESGVKPFQQTLQTKVSVFAGGRNVKQSEISHGVSSRLARIVADII